LITSLAGDAVEDVAQTTKQTFTVIGIAFGAGVLLGAATAVVCRAMLHRETARRQTITSSGSRQR
jgi:hypothetical protein